MTRKQPMPPATPHTWPTVRISSTGSVDFAAIDSINHEENAGQHQQHAACAAPPPVLASRRCSLRSRGDGTEASRSPREVSSR
jgi:hypothetical protein